MDQLSQLHTMIQLVLFLGIESQSKCYTQEQQWYQELHYLQRKSGVMRSMRYLLRWLVLLFWWYSGAIKVTNIVFFHHFFSRIAVAHIFKVLCCIFLSSS